MTCTGWCKYMVHVVFTVFFGEKTKWTITRMKKKVLGLIVFGNCPLGYSTVCSRTKDTGKGGRSAVCL